MDDKNRSIRVLLTKSQLDGHDRGVRYVMKKLSESGMEVIFTRYGIPDDIIQTAIEEDVDVIGISFSTGSPLIIASDVMKKMRENKMDSISVITGGIIPTDEIPELERIGIARCFGPGSFAKDIVNYINSIC